MELGALVQSTSCKGSAEQNHLSSGDDIDFAAVHRLFQALRVEEHEKIADD